MAEPPIDAASPMLPADIQAVIIPPTRALGEGFQVRRALPAASHMMIGPFIFFDHMGPAQFETGQGLDVRPHPHIGLATLTYLFEGEILHRDSLGSVQHIRPGEVNWMIAGAGIAHSERTDPLQRTQPALLAGIQAWIALPRSKEETAPAFVHHAHHELPSLEEKGARIRVIAGEFAGARAPVQTFSPLFYVEAILPQGGRINMPAQYSQRALYIAEGSVALSNHRVDRGRMLVLQPGKPITIEGLTPARVLLIGGEPLEEPRYVWWNFVSSSLDRIHQAKEDWQAGRFAVVPGETDFIPAPSTDIMASRRS